MALPSGKMSFRYLFLKDERIVPFPPGTRGFLYHHLPPGRPEYSAQLRFRITPTDDPVSFPQGYDLPVPQIHQKLPGPWSLPLLKTLHTRTARPLVELLLHDGLIHQHTLDLIHKHSAVHSFGKKARLLFALSDPFVYRRSLAQGNVCELRLFPFSPSGPGVVTLTMPLSRYFESGTGVFRLEKSPFAEHAGRKVVVLRCMEIWEPFVARDHVSESQIEGHRPVQGELVRRIHVRVQRPWALDIDEHRESHSAHGLRMLWDLTP
ncbi:hypothetical protein CVT24_005873 [Panaeolus cyanescens]|uniref:Uncharacterized protein n=1 Tax=Panaeolus cyanescens TaxID=181874 RepID=A0A409YF01_9AGAR|nr:hypothetical protein CVT24_005873 [Panaeolus cyanescens]